MQAFLEEVFFLSFYRLLHDGATSFMMVLLDFHARIAMIWLNFATQNEVVQYPLFGFLYHYMLLY